MLAALSRDGHARRVRRTSVRWSRRWTPGLPHLRPPGTRCRRTATCATAAVIDFVGMPASYRIGPSGLTRVPHRAHWQPTTYNALHGGLERWFEPIAPEVTAQPGMGRAADRLWRAVRAAVRALRAGTSRRTSSASTRPRASAGRRRKAHIATGSTTSRSCWSHGEGVVGGETRVFRADAAEGVALRSTSLVGAAAGRRRRRARDDADTVGRGDTRLAGHPCVDLPRLGLPVPLTAIHCTARVGPRYRSYQSRLARTSWLCGSCP